MTNVHFVFVISDDLRVNPLSPGQQSYTSEDHKSTIRISEHSTFAVNHLQELNEKISNKTQAVQALRHSQKPDTKVYNYTFMHRKMTRIRRTPQKRKKSLIRCTRNQPPEIPSTSSPLRSM